MVDKKTYDIVATIGMFIMGAIIFVLSIQAYKEVSSTCKEKAIRACLTAITAFGAAMITLPLCFWGCMWKSEKCYDEINEDEPSKIAEIYFGTGALVSLAIIICCGIVISKVDKPGCGGAGTKRYTITLLVLSIISFLGLGFGVLFASQGIPQHMNQP